MRLKEYIITKLITTLIQTTNQEVSVTEINSFRNESLVDLQIYGGRTLTPLGKKLLISADPKIDRRRGRVGVGHYGSAFNCADIPGIAGVDCLRTRHVREAGLK